MKYFIQFLFFTLFLNMFATFSIAMNPNKRAFDKKVTTASNKLKSFSCLFKTCQKGPFKSIEERTEHVRKHEKNTFLCTYSVCKNEGDTFSLNQTWLKHGVVKHQWCPYCPELNFNNDLHKLAEHISDSHTAKNVKKKKTFVCDLCENFLGFSKSDLEIHKKGKFCLPKKNIYECNFSNCREKFLDEKNAMNHVGSEHHACYWCQKESDGDKIFSSAIELSNHIADMGHTVGQKNIALHCYVCEECNHFTIWTDDAKRHLKNENHLKNSKISTIKEMIQEGRIGRKKSLAVSLECNFCDQSFSNNKRETISPLKNHILSKHHYCPFKGKEGYFGSCDFNLTSFSLEELSNHMSLKHKHCRQAEVKSVWCNNCNYIAFTTNRPHNCRVKDKNLSTDNEFNV